MARVRLSKLQRRILKWLAAEEQRTGGTMSSPHPELVQSLPHAKSNLSQSLRRLEAQRLIGVGRTPGGQAEYVYLTSAGHQRLRELDSSYD